MGDEYVEISVGTENSPSVNNNDTLEGATPIEISDLIKKANGILIGEWRRAEMYLRPRATSDSITSKINNGSGTVGALINDKKIYQNVNQATAEMQEDMEAAKHNFLLSHSLPQARIRG